MIDGNKLITVRNRNNGSTGYTIPDSGVRRDWNFEESKKIPFDELQKLMWIPGGEYMIRNLLVVEDAEALEELQIQTEPEYFYSEADIRKLLNSTDADCIEQLADFLDFAPEGAKDLARQIAVQERIPDTRKRDLISKATGFNIQTAINIQDELQRQEEEARRAAIEKEAAIAAAEQKKASTPVVKERRTAAPSTAPAAQSTTRRTSKPEYKIVK